MSEDGLMYRSKNARTHTYTHTAKKRKMWSAIPCCRDNRTPSILLYDTFPLRQHGATVRSMCPRWSIVRSASRDKSRICFPHHPEVSLLCLDSCTPGERQRVPKWHLASSGSNVFLNFFTSIKVQILSSIFDNLFSLCVVVTWHHLCRFWKIVISAVVA